MMYEILCITTPEQVDLPPCVSVMHKHNQSGTKAFLNIFNFNFYLQMIALVDQFFPCMCLFQVSSDLIITQIPTLHPVLINFHSNFLQEYPLSFQKLLTMLLVLLLLINYLFVNFISKLFWSIYLKHILYLHNIFMR